MPYDHKIAEPKWHSRWQRENAFATDLDPAKPKFYILDMFPYPSGAGLHVGHREGYTATDVLARYKRAQRLSTCCIRWAGTPSGCPPSTTRSARAFTRAKTTAAAHRQLQAPDRALGFSYDWSREIDTTDPAYVRWTQWIFLKLFERGLAYEDVAPINWCPH